MAERSYDYLSKFYQHEFEDKIPVILYSNHQDFEQSNVIYGFIGEGTGGVTESLKGRVTLPLTGSYGELNHVLTHELVHAFQFDMMEKNLRGFLGAGALPLWMMEGMAEWVSNGMDPVTAMWVADAVRRNKLPTVSAMANLQDIRVYRMGQALFEVIAQSYGTERVRRILKRPDPSKRGAAARDSLWGPSDPPAFVNRNDPTGAGMADSLAFAPGTPSVASLDKMWRTWADSLATTLASHLDNPDSVAERITSLGKYGRSFHLAPVLSPDGQSILYYSSRGLHNELFIAQKHDGEWKSRSLVAGEDTPGLESLPLLAASADWSPDGKQVAFVATEEGRDALQIYDVKKNKIVKRLRTQLFSIANPHYSPDGRFLVFSGLEGGVEDLFVIGLESGRVSRLTHDGYSERTPRFSPQGDAIVYATDQGEQTDLETLKFGSWNLAKMALHFNGEDVVAGETQVLVESAANDFSPEWSVDGQTVAFVSDRDGNVPGLHARSAHRHDPAADELRYRRRRHHPDRPGIHVGQERRHRVLGVPKRRLDVVSDARLAGRSAGRCRCRQGRDDALGAGCDPATGGRRHRRSRSPVQDPTDARVRRAGRALHRQRRCGGFGTAAARRHAGQSLSVVERLPAQPDRSVRVLDPVRRSRPALAMGHRWLSIP
jgi:hypothetical protein